MSKHKLLLADDSITIQKVVNLTFADEGIEVVTVGDGDSALLKISEAAPDLIMADVNMPGQNGYQICEAVKQNDDLKHIPVILLVGSFEPFDEDEAKRVGADDFMTKPFQSIRQLVGKVTELLKRDDRPDEDSDNENFASTNLTKSGEPLRDDIPKYSQVNYDDEMIQTDNNFHSTTAETAKLYPIEQIGTGRFETASANAAAINTVSDFEAERDEEFSAVRPESEDSYYDNREDSAENAQTVEDEPNTQTESAEIYDLAENDETQGLSEPVDSDHEPESSEKFTETQNSTENPAETVRIDNKDSDYQSEDEEVSLPHSIPKINFEEFNLLELPPLEMPSTTAETKAKVEDDTSKVNQFAETMESEISAETNKNNDTGNFSPDVIEAIAQRVFEKLSEKYFDK